LRHLWEGVKGAGCREGVKNWKRLFRKSWAFFETEERSD